MIPLQGLHRLLPIVPIDCVARGHAREVDDQELKRVHQLPKLPIVETAPARNFLEISRDIFLGEFPKRLRPHLFQERLHPGDVPSLRLLRNALAGQEFPVLLPPRGHAVLAAPGEAPRLRFLDHVLRRFPC
jgi:hypothetical protein